MSGEDAGAGTPPVPLADLAPGTVATVLELDASVSIWRDRLVAYGLVPGRRVEVVQHAPVTVVRVERIDLAFEARIAAGIVVAACGVTGAELPGGPGPAAASG